MSLRMKLMAASAMLAAGSLLYFNPFAGDPPQLLFAGLFTFAGAWIGVTN